MQLKTSSRQELVARIEQLEHSHAEALSALQDSQNRWRDTVEKLPGIICEFNTELIFTYVNSLAYKIFGYTVDDLHRGVSIMTVIHPDDRQECRRNMNRILSGEEIEPHSYRMLHRDGHSMDYFLINTYAVYKDGVQIGFRSVLLDVSAEKRAERRLRESEERFRTIFEKSPSGIALITKQLHILEANEAFRCFYPQFDIQKVLSRNDIQHIDECKTTSFTDKQSLSGTDKTQVKSFEWVITPLTKGQRHAAEFLIQVEDITARLEGEQARLSQAMQLVENLRSDMVETFTFNNMVSRSPRMKQVFDMLPQIAAVSTPVLITGESGTGKELIARSLHDLSDRAQCPFVAINCSALPDSLLESELFGYKAGAFTDAKKNKPGKFAIAEGGTLFLDEIGDISAAMQAKLLRFLQEKTYEPLGSTTSVRSNVRIIAATHKDLSELVSRGIFREDLYFRIHVLRVHLIALRERICDITLLCSFFVKKFNARYNKSIRGVSRSVEEILHRHTYPGNIRELENIIEHAFVFCDADTIEPAHLPQDIRDRYMPDSSQLMQSVNNLEQLEGEYIRAMIKKAGGNKLQAARMLGIHKSTLFRKLKKLHIEA